MSDDRKPVHFTAGHALYNFHVSKSDFDKSLYYNLLLQPILGWSDHFLLGGEYLHQHLLEAVGYGESWLESGLSEGYVKPFFRIDAPRLADVYQHLAQRGIKGVNLEKGQGIAERLDKVLVPNKIGHWPKWMAGEAFEEELKRHLGNSDPYHPVTNLLSSREQRKLKNFWMAPEVVEWRYRHVEEAGILTKERGEAGLRLGDLIEVSQRNLLKGTVPGSIWTVKGLLDKAKKHHQGTKIPRRLGIFYKIVCEIYNRNLADALVCDRNSPKWDVNTAVLDMETLVGEPFSSENRSDGFSEEVYLPTIDCLKKLPGKWFLQAREKGENVGYFDNLERWKTDPSDNNAGQLITSVVKYSMQIREGIDSALLRPYSARLLVKNDIPILVGGVVGAAMEQLSSTPGLGAVSGAFAAVFASGIANRRPKERVCLTFYPGLHGGVRINKDVTLPAPVVSQKNEGNTEAPSKTVQ